MANRSGPRSAAGSPRARADALEQFFCTDKGAPRARLMSKGIKDQFPDLDSAATAAQTRAVNLAHERKGLAVITATIALYRLAGAVLRALHGGESAPRRARLRRSHRQGGQPAARPSSRPPGCCSSSTAASTTSSSTRRRTRAPSSGRWSRRWRRSSSPALGQREERAHAVCRRRREAVDLQLPGRGPAHVRRDGPALRSACRSGRAHVAAHPARSVVPHRGADPGARSTASSPITTARRASRRSAATIRHAVHRMGHGGLIEIWPTVTAGGRQAGRRLVAARRGGARARRRSGSPSASRQRSRLARQRRAARVRGSADPRRATSSILVRKRRPFAAPMVAALKARGIPVAGADRLRLTDQIAVAGPDLARRFPHAARGRPGARRGAEKPAHRLSTTTTSWRSQPAARARCGSR